jgi:hypothetical protein
LWRGLPTKKAQSDSRFSSDRPIAPSTHHSIRPSVNTGPALVHPATFLLPDNLRPLGFLCPQLWYAPPAPPSHTSPGMFRIIHAPLTESHAQRRARYSSLLTVSIFFPCAAVPRRSTFICLSPQPWLGLQMDLATSCGKDRASIQSGYILHGPLSTAEKEL